MGPRLHSFIRAKNINVRLVSRTLLFVVCFVALATYVKTTASAETASYPELPRVSETENGIDNQQLERETEMFTEIVDFLQWTNPGACKLHYEFGGRIVKSNNITGLDGQKAVCMDPGLSPKPGDCIVYSMGLRNNWLFDLQMDEYGCKVFAFDPTMHSPFSRSDTKIQFFKMGLGTEDIERSNGEGQVKSLQTIRQELGHEEKVIDYLKVDINGREWNLLESAISDNLLKNVRQLSLKIYLPFTDQRLQKLIDILHDLEDDGFIRFFSRENVWHRQVFPGGVRGSSAYDIAWYNVNFMKV